MKPRSISRCWMSRVVSSCCAAGSTGAAHRLAEVVAGEEADGTPPSTSTCTPRTPGMPRTVRTSWPTRAWSGRPSRPAANRAPRSTVTTRCVTVTERRESRAEQPSGCHGCARPPSARRAAAARPSGSWCRCAERTPALVRDEPDVPRRRRPSRPAPGPKTAAREKRCISWQSDSPPGDAFPTDRQEKAEPQGTGRRRPMYRRADDHSCHLLRASSRADPEAASGDTRKHSHSSTRTGGLPTSFTMFSPSSRSTRY